MTQPKARQGGYVILIDNMHIDCIGLKKTNEKWKAIYKALEHYQWDIEYVPANGIHTITVHDDKGNMTELISKINAILRPKRNKTGDE